MVIVSAELVLKAAKFIQNHKLKADEVVYNGETETIKFLNKKVEVIAWLDYNNTPGKKNFKII